jgi:hypothetical protein
MSHQDYWSGMIIKISIRYLRRLDQYMNELISLNAYIDYLFL